MTPETDFRNLTDEQRFDLLEHPEAWPEDPVIQAELVELLELHLALGAPSVHGELLGSEPAPVAWWQKASRSGWLAAAVAVLALLPAGFAYRRVNTLKTQAQNRSHLEVEAQRRAQDRLWADFFIQTSMVIRDFQQNPKACAAKREDRSEEREAATVPGSLDGAEERAAGLVFPGRGCRGRDRPHQLRTQESGHRRRGGRRRRRSDRTIVCAQPPRDDGHSDQVSTPGHSPVARQVSNA